MMLAARAAVRRAPIVSGSVRYPAVATRAAQRGAPMIFAARAASTRSRLAVVAVPARGFAATSANNLVPAALRGLDYVGTVAFAASGTMVAGHAGMDILGCTMVGTITSLGGGTIRDLLLGRTPVFWFREVEYLLLCVGTALAAFYAHDKLEGPAAEQALWWGDTLGIGAFSVVGAQAAACAPTTLNAPIPSVSPHHSASSATGPSSLS